jgi:hypothetical protein
LEDIDADTWRLGGEMEGGLLENIRTEVGRNGGRVAGEHVKIVQRYS